MADPFYPFDPTDDRSADEKFIDDLRSQDTDGPPDPMLRAKFAHVFDNTLHSAGERLQFCSMTLARSLSDKKLTCDVFERVVSLRDAELVDGRHIDFIVECNNQFMLYGDDSFAGYNDALEQNFYFYPDIDDPVRRLRTMSLLLREWWLYDKVNGALDEPAAEWRDLEEFWAFDLMDDDSPTPLEDRVAQCHVLLESHIAAGDLMIDAIEPFLYNNLDGMSRLWRDPDTGQRSVGRRIYCRNTILNVALYLPFDHARASFWVGVAAQILAQQAPDENDTSRDAIRGKITLHMRTTAGYARFAPLLDAVDCVDDTFDLARGLAHYESMMRTQTDNNWPETAADFLHDMVAYPHVMQDIGFRATLNMIADNAIGRTRMPRHGADTYHTLVMQAFCDAYEREEHNIVARIAAFRDIAQKTARDSYMHLFARTRADVLELAADTMAQTHDMGTRDDARVAPYYMPRFPDVN